MAEGIEIMQATCPLLARVENDTGAKWLSSGVEKMNTL